MKTRNIFIGLTFLVSGASQAAFIDGSVEIGGAFVPINVGGTQVGLDVATGIDFTTNGLVLASSGDLSPLTFGTPTAMTDFQFSPLSPNPVDVWNAGGFVFSMNAVAINNQNTTNLSLSGSGTVTGAGFDDTAGTWQFTANTVDGSTTFSWSSSTLTAVPVPAAVWLFGSGLLGMVGIARRRRS